ncbi:MAG: hypothetical protein J0L53_03615 [Spirochaetes bacterium]|nr:hypothetical protein [Spirochaetota bacterium]MBX3723247.1 hypothetical protein [Turneriella sp.]
MRHHYQRIDSVADIDTARITLKSIENRYIDAQGRRYATRFNLRTHKIEIIPIALGREEALLAKRLAGGVKPAEATAPETRTERRVHPQPMKMPQWLGPLNIEPDTRDAELHPFLISAEREMQRNGERYRGLIQSLKMSSVLEDMKDSNQHDAILELTNTYERDIQAHAGRVQAMVVEFLRFPKPLASYLGQIDRNCKKYVEKLDPEKQKRYCQAYLLAGEMFAVFSGSQDLINMIERFTAEAKPEKLNYDRKGAFESAMQSLGYLKESLTQEIAKFLGVLATADVI